MWVDVSNAHSPYDNEFFDVAWSPGGIFAVGQVPSAEADAPVIPAEDLPCDFASGDTVRALQVALVAEGELDAASVTGVFDAATCKAWHSMYGEAPTPAALSKVMAPGVSCETVVMPACSKLPKPSWTVGKIVTIGAATVGGMLVLSYLTRKR